MQPFPKEQLIADKDTYLAIAAKARAEADAANLENVRERCLRSEAAWNTMAARHQSIEDFRSNRLAEAANAAHQPETGQPQKE